MARNRKRRAPARDPLSFNLVQLRARTDGWTPERQIGFIRALAASGCVRDAAQSVGMSAESAYRLARRSEAQGFRIAWQRAMRIAMGRLADAVLSRAIHGVARPIFYKGEQIGEERRYNDRLAMFLLRTRHRDFAPVDEVELLPDQEKEAVGLDDVVQLAVAERVAAEQGKKPQIMRVFPEPGEHPADYEYRAQAWWDAEYPTPPPASGLPPEADSKGDVA
ncbi:MAG TPA: hypothetical protein VI407_05855 [Erythrobacter sp.]